MDYILETLGKVGFDWKMGLFNLVNFLVIFWILKRYAFGPVMSVIEKRQEKIQEGIDNYTKSKTELQMAEKKAQDIVDQAKVDANKIVEQGHVDAQGVAETMKVKAKKEIELLVAQAKKNIEIDKREMQDGLRKDTVELVIIAVEKILGEKMDDKRDEKYIQDILATLKS
ncbi:F0F1 ATP synthase subunit B [Candidatus Nomurabacteria bacterium]|nr:F0F1 ATP synthase subunit B [Candidatus Nomurabacteria bacterium]